MTRKKCTSLQEIDGEIEKIFDALDKEFDDSERNRLAGRLGGLCAQRSFAKLGVN